ncbi:tyrosine-type recombinase/integrase [Microbispora siamensis]
MGEVTAAKDFDAKRDTQAKDKLTGLPVWQVPVMDANPSLKAAQKTVTVKILSEAQPVVPPSLPGVPPAPAEFDGAAGRWARCRRPQPRRRLTGLLVNARHTAGTLLVEQGVHIRVVQEILGHARVTTTERYTHIASLQVRGVSERMGAVLWGED